MKKKAWKEVNAESVGFYNRLIILRMQELICEQVKACKEEEHLEMMAGFCGGLNGMHFVSVIIYKWGSPAAIS